MKKFVIQISVFVSLAVIIVQTLLWTQNNYINEKATFKLEDSISYIVIGNSHAECAFNDSLISNFKNVASSGESYFYSYVKLKNILDQNKQIKTVFVEFTNLSISISNDRWIWEKEFMNNRVAQFLPFLSWSEKSLLIKNNFINFINSESLAMRNNTNRFLTQDFDFTEELGGYEYLKRFSIDSLLLVKDNESENLDKENEPSIYGLFYLDKIVDFCKTNNVNIIFVRSPQHNMCNHRNNEELLQSLKNKRYKEVEFLDFNDFQLSNDEFGDFEHLNYKGAKIFSKWFESNIITFPLN